MKKWIKKHIVFENNSQHFQDSFIVASIWFEKSYGGYAMEFVILNLGFYARYNTEKSLRYFRKLEKESKGITYKLVKVKKTN